MAIDRNKAKKLLDEISAFFDEITGKIPNKEIRDLLRKNILRSIIVEIEEVIIKSRAPVMYLIGRSGHGKSSLVNALANRDVAEVGATKPTTPKSTSYTVTFEETYSTWEIIDSRGLFETTSPKDASPQNALDYVKKDIEKYKPDVILHVISAPEVRALENDFKAFEDISKTIKKSIGVVPPTIIVLNRIDTLENPREWPPEKSAREAWLIKELLDYMTLDILKQKVEKIDLNFPIKGYKIFDSNYIGIIPVCSLEDNLWNIETLSMFIGEYLPKSALLDFYQAQKRKGLLRKISTLLIKRFSRIAAPIGSLSIPIADIVILTPLQMLMIALIGGLSCRSFSKETIHEFLVAEGINIGTGVGLRKVAQQLVKLIPAGGPVVSGAIASVGTYCIGKSAEAYFFSGEKRKPEEFSKEWKDSEDNSQVFTEKPSRSRLWNILKLLKKLPCIFQVIKKKT